MNNRPLYLNPKAYTLSALVIGYLLIGDYTANQQNAIGNWLMTVGQILEANSAIQQAVEEKYQGNSFNINSEQFKKGGSPYMDNPPLTDFLSQDEETIKKIKEELESVIDKINHLHTN